MAVPDDTPDSTARTQEAWKVLDLALRIGEVLLSAGAGAADVAAQMLNVAHACGMRNVTADITFTQLTMGYQPSPDEPPVSQVRQVRHRETDYEHLTQVDHLVRALINGDLTPDEARPQLGRIVSTGHSLPRWAVTVGWGVMNAGVALMLDGTWLSLLIAFLAAVGVDRIQRLLARRRLPAFYQQVAGGLFATLLAVGVGALGLGIGPGRVITSSIILLLAGVSFMGAIQDALTGFPLTAGARILEAMLATAGVIAGVSGGLSVARMGGVDLGRLNPGAAALGPMPLTVVGGMVTAAAFAFSSYAPRRSLLPIGVIGGAATLAYYVVYLNSGGIAWASALAAILVGLVSFSVAGRFRVPALVVVVSGVVPLLPGLSIYRGLAQMTTGGSDGLISIVGAAAIAIALAAGVILGEYVAQPLKREARRLESKLAGPRLVGPLRVRSSRARG
ncbi:MAG TPA: threonine/serine exporter family protein [Marmoricola sp.]|nr:threonine/serine exporter family protein [Marmoricola sp.]